MLAATRHTTVADWIIGAIFLVLVLALLVFLVAFLVRRFAPGAPRRSLDRVESALTVPPPGPGAPRLKRALLVRMPVWVALPLVFLGGWFALVYPMGRDWYRYGVALAVAVLIGFWTKRRFHSRVLYRGRREVVTWSWVGPAKDGSALPPVVVEPRDEHPRV
jgi:hypothetical protein